MRGPKEKQALWVEASNLADVIDGQIPLDGPKIEEGVDGVLQILGGDSSDELERFVQLLYSLELVNPRVYFGDVNPDEAERRLADDPQAAVELITYIVRAERFNEGLLQLSVNQGTLTRAFRSALDWRTRSTT